MSGGFDPIHSGHLAYLKAAKALGDELVVGVNTDDWLFRKKGASFMPWHERKKIVESIKDVDYVVTFNDDDNSARQLITRVRENNPDAKLIFANGGDRTKENIPEMDVKDHDLEFVFGVGGDDKMNSSSWILEEWKAPKTNRTWGYYRVLHEPNNNVKLKELTVEPGACLSMQRHFKRSEFWFVSEGEASVYSLDSTEEVIHLGHFNIYDNLFIQKGQWHRLCNETAYPLKIIEIQYGDECVEEDIVRK